MTYLTIIIGGWGGGKGLYCDRNPSKLHSLLLLLVQLNTLHKVQTSCLCLSIKSTITEFIQRSDGDSRPVVSSKSTWGLVTESPILWLSTWSGQRIYISNQFQGDAAAAGPRTKLREPQLLRNYFCASTLFRFCTLYKYLYNGKE